MDMDAMPEAANDQGPARLVITDADLDAYVRGRLSPRRRREVEGFLACNPDMAAGVMTQFHFRSDSAPPRRRKGFVVTAMAVGLAACVGAGAGWAAGECQDLDGWRRAGGGAPPEYVEEAQESREAAELRQQMVSQAETPHLNVTEIRERLRIRLPSFPGSWRVHDVQVFPTDTGPGVNLLIEAPDRRRLQLFAVAVTSGDRRPEVARKGDEVVAYWQRDGAAYVVSGPRSPAELMQYASSFGAD
jgi:hypothetical protein